MLVGTGIINDEIAFVSTRTGYSEIYLMDVNRGFVENLTALSAFAYNPAWSPDGAQIAFESSHDGEFSIWVTDASGRNLRRLLVGRGGARVVAGR
jgi:TolB protein